MSDGATNPEIGRILRASIMGFAVGSRVGQLSVPAFGGLVKAQPIDQGEAIYGLIYNMNIDDDPLVRRLVLAEYPPEAVINDQRQNRLLPIEMSVLAIGYLREGEIYHALPPRPPLNLDPVHLVRDLDELRNFSDNLAYLRLILRAAGGNVPVDQLLVAHVTDVYRLRSYDDPEGAAAWAQTAVIELIELLRANYEMRIPTLEALSQALPVP